MTIFVSGADRLRRAIGLKVFLDCMWLSLVWSG